jgi:lipopolysaccharide transport system permease protein
MMLSTTARGGARMAYPLWRHRRALLALVRHSARRAHADTAAGRIWAVVTPLLSFVILALVLSLGLRARGVGAPYVYTFGAAFVPWILLSAGITAAAGSIVDHRYLVKRVRFTAEVIPVAPPVAESLPHVVLVVLVGTACAVAGYAGWALFALPYFYACVLVLAVGVGMWLAATAVFVRDVLRLLPAVLMMWFWLTPIAWDEHRLPDYARPLVLLNPAAYVADGYRHALMPQVFGSPSLGQAAAFWIIAIAVLVSGFAYFRRLRPAFWECL